MRSQGHIHAPSPLNGWSTPEVYEIWRGRACVLMQETADDERDRGRFDWVPDPQAKASLWTDFEP